MSIEVEVEVDLEARGGGFVFSVTYVVVVSNIRGDTLYISM